MTKKYSERCHQAAKFCSLYEGLVVVKMSGEKVSLVFISILFDIVCIQN